MTRLAKTTVYLTPAEYRRIKLLARRQNRPAAELVREAVVQYARRNAPAKRPRSVAAGRSGHGKLSERAEDLLAGLSRSR